MDVEKFSMKDLQQLDDISYDEVDRIIAKYEEIRQTLMRWLNAQGEHAYKYSVSYDRLDKFLADMSQSKDVKKRRAILAQMKKEYCHDD